MPEIKIYNLRIVPPNPVFDEIIHFKKQFIDIFGKQPLSKSKPHITLAVFKMDLQYQDKLLEAFNQLSSIERFKLAIEGFGIFENYAHVLLLKVPQMKDFERIHKQVKILWQYGLQRKPDSLNLSKTPHITISKTAEKKMLYESLEYFLEEDYFREISVNQLTLVSRYDGKSWDWEHHIKLS